jgi:serine/threonine protein kinase
MQHKKPQTFHPSDTALLTNVSPGSTGDDTLVAMGLPDGTQPVAMGSGVVTKLISRGGTALVYEIWNQELEMSRAVKLLHPDHLTESLERFETEIKITAKLRHPNIVEIYAVGKWSGLPFIEMERIQGHTLDELMERTGALPVEICTSVGIMVARALYYAHTQKYMIYGKEYQGIIHRDLKPANIMVDRDGSVKLMDFGIAKPVSASGRTMEGVVFGTMQYLSPEQMQSGNVDSRSDIYSFGAVLYELLTGRKTFPDQNLAKLVTDKLNNHYRPLDDFDLPLPPALKLLMYSCLNYQKSRRIQSALALEKTLERIHLRMTGGKTPEEVLRQFMTSPPAKKRIVNIRKRHTGLAIVLGVFSFLALAGAGTFVYFRVHDVLSRQQAITAQIKALRATTSETDSTMTVYTVPRLPQPLPEAALLQEPVRTTPPPAVRPQPAFPVSKPQASQQPSRRVYLAQEAATAASNALRAGRPGDALAVLGALAPGIALTTELKMIQFHALAKMGNDRAYSNYLLSQDINDGEFCIAKALYFCTAGETGKARLFYDRSMKMPAEFADAAQMEESRMYCKALIASALFSASPSDETKKEAMDSWYDIKLHFRQLPSHPWYQKADAEIHRINSVALQ